MKSFISFKKLLSVPINNNNNSIHNFKRLNYCTITQNINKNENNNDMNSSLSQSFLNNNNIIEQQQQQQQQQPIQPQPIQHIQQQPIINKNLIVKNNQKEFLTMLTTNIKSTPKYISSSQFLLEKSIDPLLLKTEKPDDIVKVKNRYIVVGLGNPGDEYTNTRHNVGFLTIDHLCDMFDCKLDQDSKHSLYTTVYLKLDEKLSSTQKNNNRQEKKQFHSKQVETIKNLFINKQINGDDHDDTSTTTTNVNTTTTTTAAAIANEQEQDDDHDINLIKKPKKVINQVIFLKPMTYMNSSGNPLRAIQQKYNVPIENILVIVDDISNDLGVIKMKTKGGSAGQKGIDSVISRLGTEKFSRIKFGVGIPQPGEIRSNFVMKRIHNSQEKEEKVKSAIDKVARYCIMWLEKGSDFTMNKINK